MSSPDEAAQETPRWIEELAKIRSDLRAIGHRVDQLELQLNPLPLEKREAQQVEPTSKPIEPQPTVPKPAVITSTLPNFQLPSRHVLRSTERAMSPAQSHRAQADKEYVTPDVVPGLRKPSAAVKRTSKLAIPADIDWEAVIGGRWMTWVGAFTLLLAVGFGVHWAWSTLQTPPWVHVLSIHLLGAGFLVAAHFINRRGLPLAARALVGLGIFTLYAAAFAALHLYKLWPEQTAFIECAGLTAMAIALALAQTARLW